MSVVRRHWLAVAGVALLAAQLGIGFAMRPVTPPRDLMPPIPSERALHVQSMGDPQFLFRLYALQIQNAGDTGGRVVPVKNYDFGLINDWLMVLQQLDTQSQFPIGIALRYFGASQNVENVRPVIAFAEQNVALDPRARWHWLYDAIYLAEHRLGDKDLALAVARNLAAYGPGTVPPWAAMTPAFVLEQRGQPEEAAAIIRQVAVDYRAEITPEDGAWIDNYLQQLLNHKLQISPPPNQQKLPQK